MVGAHYATSYCASKGGVINLTRQLATDYSPLGVRVNAICPGYVANSMGRSVPGTPANVVPDGTAARANGATPTQEVASERWENRIKAAAEQPLVRMGAEDEIASVAIFLATEGASFMTGCIVPVDGGCTATFAGSAVQTMYDPADYVSPISPKL